MVTPATNILFKLKDKIRRYSVVLFENVNNQVIKRQATRHNPQQEYLDFYRLLKVAYQITEKWATNKS